MKKSKLPYAPSTRSQLDSDRFLRAAQFAYWLACVGGASFRELESR